MYICLECGEIFESPKRIIDEEYYGCYQYDYVCPYCGGDYVEVVECLGCGKNFGEEDLTEGFCKKCEKEIQDKVKKLFEQFNEKEKNYIFESGILDEV